MEQQQGRTGPFGNHEDNEAVIPESVHSFFREDGQVLGYLVIDSNIDGVSVGGIRMVPEMPVADLCHLARVMTLKYSFLKLPFGGAKAAILTHCETPSSDQRRADVESFARCLIPFRGRYLPGEDAGTNSNDLELIRRIARLDRVRHAPDSGFYTGLTVRICIEQLMRERRLAPAQCMVAVEGFGKVGGWAATLLAELGCRIVAVSTNKGALYDPNGLDIDALLRARNTRGDDCTVPNDGARRIETADLLTLPVDFLVPCALSWSIATSNVNDVQAKMVVCGANNAVTDKGRQALAARGITCLPDFVSNSGGVLGSMIEMLCMDRARAVEILRREYEPRVENILVQARSTGQAPEAVARAIAAANREQMRLRQTSTQGRLSALTAWAYRHGLLPRAIVKPFASTYIHKMMA